MNSAERQALREKHRQYGSYCFTCGYWNEEVGDYDSASYPCDVIKVLDVWEANSKKALDALDHINTMRVDEDDFEWIETAENILNGE